MLWSHESMLREHIAAWTTVAFAVLLLLLTITDQGGALASLLLLAWALIMLALFVATEQAAHRHERREA
jgi:L-asparagine transporter-like permease